MRIRLLVLSAVLVVAVSLSSSAVPARSTPTAGPVVRDMAGGRAFDDLGRYYAHPDSLPPFAAALARLDSHDSAANDAAGLYLLRLFQLSLADESSGRAAWAQTPYWGGGQSSQAREFREDLAGRFGESATGSAALPVLDWLLRNEPVPEIQAKVAPALGRMRGPGAQRLVGSLMRGPQANGAVLIEAIRATRTASFVSLIPDLRRLSLDDRESVRRAAGDALVALGAGPPPEWRPTAAFPRWLGDVLHTCAARVWTPVPRGARWADFATDADGRLPGHLEAQHTHGWLLAEEDTTYHVLDEFAREIRLSRRRTRLVPETLADESARIAALRRAPHTSGADAGDALSSGGGLTAQFEPGAVSLPEILVAAWSLERGDTASAAALIFPRLDALADDHELDRIARDLLGNVYHLRMLAAFSYDRDYARTMALAEHLSGPSFAGYAYAPRARELRAQLASRQADFRGFALPDSAEWRRRCRALDRPQRIAFLCEHLRLLNAFQWSQPGGPDLRVGQYAEAMHMTGPWDTPENHSRRLVNPYTELVAMQLTPADLPSLAPALADVRYMPTFGFWREFHPARDLYRVCDVVAGLINEAAHQTLVDADSIPGLTPGRRTAMANAVAAWGRVHSRATPEDLRIELLETTTVAYEFQRAVDEGLASGDPRVPPIVIARIDAFPRALPFVLASCARANTDAFVPLARRQLAGVADVPASGWEPTARVFYPALILLRHGDPQGFPVVQRILAADADGYWLREAFEPLLATRDSAARALLCASARKPRLMLDHENSALLRRLIHEGCAGVAEDLGALLGSDKPHGNAYATNASTGEPIQRDLVEGDAVAEYVAEWRPGGERYDNLLPDAQRARRREELRLWLAEESRRVRAEKMP